METARRNDNATPVEGCGVGFLATAGNALREWPGAFTTNDRRFRAACTWGRLAVPLRRDQPCSTTIEIAYVRIPCRRPSQAAPIVVLAGGPGGSGVDDLRRERDVLEALLEVGDVIGLDQRGVGLAQPCLTASSVERLPMERPLERDDVIEAYRRHARAQRDAWQAVGIELACFNTRESAADVDDLRQALGLDQVCLVGESYGSHLGLAVLKAHGHGVERAVLGLVEGPDDTWKLPSNVDRFFDGIGAELTARAWGGGHLPPLPDLMREVHQRLRAAPMALPQGSDAPACRWLSETALQFVAGAALGNVHALAALPAIYAELWRGRCDRVAAALVGWDGVIDDDAMSLAMDSASGGTAARRARVEAERHRSLLGDTMNLPFPHIDADIGALDLGDDFRAPVHSDVPTLLLSGSVDGRTPESNARAVQAGLSRSAHVLLHGCGHHLQPATGYLADVQAFLRGETVSDAGARRVPLVFEPL